MVNKYSFENFIMQCCKAKETSLRKFLRKTLENAGFVIIEDDYKSRRGGDLANVHNMLAIRGNPKVCLVAHTDVCRDHDGIGDYTPVEPVIKTVRVDGKERKIIQDRNCKAQVGGDDRLGVAINSYIALNAGYDLALLFTTDEEIGLISAGYVDFPELKEFQLFVQTDRGNHSNQLIPNICGTRICSQKVEQRLLDISEQIQLPRVSTIGMVTDVYQLIRRGKAQNCVNMTIGYHNSYGAQQDEYIDVQEAYEAMKYVSTIIKEYDLNDFSNEDKSYEEEDPYEEDDAISDYKTLDAEVQNVYEEEVSKFSQTHYKKKIRGASFKHRNLFSEEEYNKDRGFYSEQLPRRGSGF